jgi:hypothetical protein
MIERLWNWHEEAGLVCWAATPLGRLLLWGSAAVLFGPDLDWPLLLLLGLSFVAPQWRTELLALGGLWALYTLLPSATMSAGRLSVMVGMLLVLLLAWGLYQGARRFGQLPAGVRRRPLLWTHAVLLGLTLGAALLPVVLGSPPPSRVNAVSLALRVLIPFLLWRASYLMMSARRGTVVGTRFRDHALYLFPVWGGSGTPFGKGYDYLRAQRADEGPELAQARLAGLKLLLLAWGWIGVRSVVQHLVYGRPVPLLVAALGQGSLGLPGLATAMDAGPAGYSLATRWGILAGEFVIATLRFAINGHLIIGVLRLFGFRVFRNTYKPLLAKTLVEFWNRLYYYFKELLVEFFFYPAFLATTGRRHGTRIFIAVMAAAGLGNLYYHLVRDFPAYFLSGRDVIADRLGGRLVYSGLLGLGIVVSMLRERGRRAELAAAPSRWQWARSLRAVLGVWLFYSLLHIWNVGLTQLTLGQRARFLAGMFGL